VATPYALDTPTAPLQDPALLAAAGFLAGYSGTTHSGYVIDLRGWWRFCELHGLDVFDAKRAHLELYIRSLEDHPYARSTIGRRISTVATFYRWCVEEELLDRNPAAHVRRPKIDQESTTLGLDRSERPFNPNRQASSARSSSKPVSTQPVITPSGSLRRAAYTVAAFVAGATSAR
jgi:hypothetical protein